MIPLPSKRTLRKYGLTASQFIDLWDLSTGRCPLCNKPFNAKVVNRAPVIDHDHKTGMVRGLLCRACNYELGCLHDNDRWLAAAARYLQFPPAQQIWNDVPRVSGAPPLASQPLVKEND